MSGVEQKHTPLAPEECVFTIGAKRQIVCRCAPVLGIQFYNARWYDPYIMMFVSPDTLIPDPYNPLDWNRYLYARGNPVNLKDPTGHFACGDGTDDPRCEQYDPSTLSSVRTPNSPTTLDAPTLPSPNDVITTTIIVIDGVSFVISGVEAVLADVVGAGIIGIGCGTTGLGTAGVGCGAFAVFALKVDMAIASYGSPIGTIENLLGIASTGLTWYSDKDNIWTPNSSYVSVGKDTLISVRNTILGQIPESNIDALISFSQLKYDLDRLDGVDPGGRVEIIGNRGVNPSLGKDLLNFLLYDW